ncbi:MAG: hypothetical protein OXC48_03185, partial [Endozoicomonadaceae bacterium]|nr:hypothetical protein [Endozoicomonadaceae bacterium]
KYCTKLFFTVLLIFSALFAYAGGDELSLLIKQATDTNGQKRLKAWLNKNPETANQLIRDKNGIEINPLIRAVLRSKNIKTAQLQFRSNSANIDQGLPDKKTTLAMGRLATSAADITEIVDFLLGSDARDVYIIAETPLSLIEQMSKQIAHLAKQSSIDEADLAVLEQGLEVSAKQQREGNAQKTALDPVQKTGPEDMEMRQKQLKLDAKMQKLLMLEQELKDLKAKNDTDMTDGNSQSKRKMTLSEQLQNESIHSMSLVNNTFFILQLFVEHKSANQQNYVDAFKKYIKILFFIHDALYNKRSELSPDLKEFIEKTNLTQQLVHAYHAVEAEDTSTDALTVDEFKKRHYDDCVQKNKYLRQCLNDIESSSELADLQTLAYINVWIGGELGQGNMMLSQLESFGFTEDQIKWLRFSDQTPYDHFQSMLQTKLLILLDTVGMKYPEHNDKFMKRVEDSYVQKQQILTGIMATD